MTGTRVSLHIWRALACASSALALVFTLQSRSNAQLSAGSGVAPPAVAQQTLADPRPQSLSVVAALSEAGDESALAVLIGSAEDAPPEVASAALTGIAQIGGPRALGFLGQRFARASAAELPELARALARMGGPNAREILLRAARSARSAGRDAALEALADLDTPDVRQFMLDSLSGPDAARAAAYFGDCRDARAVPGLERLARDSTTDLRRTAIDALFAQGHSAHAAIERLLRDDDELSDSVLESPAPTVALRQAQRAASILRLRAGTVSAGPVFEFLTQDLSDEARQALVRAAHEPASVDSAIQALAARGDSESVRALSQLTNAADPELASRATCALLGAPDSRSRPLLIRAANRLPAEATAALLRIHAPEAHGALARLSVSSTPSERLEAERLTARYGSGS